MRDFIFFSRNARTSGNFNDLMKAGRMDIVCHVVINSFFISHRMREDVKLHLVFYGPPTPPRHIEIFVKNEEGMPETGKKVGSLDISKKDIAGLIKRILFKYQEGRKVEAFPGCFIEKKSLIKIVEELAKTRAIYLLDRNGDNVREIEIKENPIFILGDHEGLPKKELRRLSKSAKKVSLGKANYFSSQVVSILNNELDYRGL